MKKLRFLFVVSVLSLFGAISAAAEPSENKELVVAFYEQALIQENVEAAALKFLREDYIQHNPNVPTGRQGFIDGLTGWFSAVDVKFSIVRAIAEADHVVLHVKQEIGDSTTAIIDIFRVEDGMIVEHWDVSQAVPENMAHQNGMF